MLPADSGHPRPFSLLRIHGSEVVRSGVIGLNKREREWEGEGSPENKTDELAGMRLPAHAHLVRVFRVKDQFHLMLDDGRPARTLVDRSLTDSRA